MGLTEDLAQLERQERELVLSKLDAETAWALGTWLREAALARKLTIVADVRRFGGQQIFYMALDGTTPDNPEWVRRKSNVVERFHRSSYATRLRLLAKNETLQSKQGLPMADFAEHGGSFPLRVAGSGVVGSITVSGLDGRDDHAMAVEAICTLLGKNYDELKLSSERPE